MRHSARFSRAVWSAVAVLPFLLAAVSAPAHAEEKAEQPPLEVAQRFLRAFVQKDFQTVRALFAPNAVVASTLLSSSGPHEMDYMPLEDWIKEAEQELAPIKDFTIEPVESSVLVFDNGASVSIRFHSTGRAGKVSFVTEGVDTYSMIQVDGAWRILRYSYIELMKFV